MNTVHMYYVAVEHLQFASVAAMCSTLGLPEEDIQAAVIAARGVSPTQLVLLDDVTIGPAESYVTAVLDLQTNGAVTLYAGLLGQASADRLIVESHAAEFRASIEFAGKRVLVVGARLAVGTLQ
jgi:hypothetical protein